MTTNKGNNENKPNRDRPSPIREDKSGDFTRDAPNTIVDTHKPPTNSPSNGDSSESND